MEAIPSLNTLASEVAEILNRDNVDCNVPLGELGIDSLNVVELILVCEKLYPNVANPELFAFDQNTTLSDIYEQFSQNLIMA